MTSLFNLLPFLFFLVLPFVSHAESADPLGQFCNQDTVISKASPIWSNIDAVLTKLVSKGPSNGFLTTSYGSGYDKVYALAQCRGDVSHDDCSNCIQDASKQIRQLCPGQANVRIWYDYCFLRYNNQTFIGEVDTSFGIFYFNVVNVTDPTKFNKELGNLMDQIKDDAVVPKNRGLGKGETKLTPFIILYALVQCTRDLPKLSCAQCLAIIVGNFPNFCNDRKGCRVLYSSCYVRYELYLYFFLLNRNDSNIANGETIKKLVYP